MLGTCGIAATKFQLLPHAAMASHEQGIQLSPFSAIPQSHIRRWPLDVAQCSHTSNLARNFTTLVVSDTMPPLFVPYNEESTTSPFVTNTTTASSSALHPPTQRPGDEPSIRPHHLISPLPTTAPIIPRPPTPYQPTRVYFRRSARLRSTTLKKAVESMAKKHTIAAVSERATADNHASRSTRATKTPTYLFASHDTDDTPTTLHGPTRKRKKQDTASASPPAKRHRKAIKRGTRAHAKTTPETDHEDSDSSSEYNPVTPEDSDDDYGIQTTRASLREYLEIVDYPEDATELEPQFYEDLCAIAKDLLSFPANAGSRRAHLKVPKLVKVKAGAKKPCPCPSSSSPRGGCSRSFTRAADLERHLIFSHLGITVTCVNKVHKRPAVLSRPDSVPRHMGKSSRCMGPRKYAALKRTTARRLGGGVGADSKECKHAILQEYARISVPCYQKPAVKQTLTLLQTRRTPRELEKWLEQFGRVMRCGCKACRSHGSTIDQIDELLGPGVADDIGPPEEGEGSDPLSPGPEPEEGVEESTPSNIINPTSAPASPGPAEPPKPEEEEDPSDWNTFVDFQRVHTAYEFEDEIHQELWELINMPSE
ncbi:hypothetical protein C8Q74DRAFT_1261014 [Fomes fomentarius]|nr:hypothetical protein C8Q74DRAFT_1261014 [Fomes fomentarius]